ncbi:MAG: hypothetical protein LBT69_04905 [Lactobacillales bacterium]|jgi:hypothetical protein|nr:hypothetical protein [Lactobacillales bacterium]
MGLKINRADNFDDLFNKFAKMDDPNAGKNKKERKEADNITTPKLAKGKGVDKELVEKERKKRKIVK